MNNNFSRALFLIFLTICILNTVPANDWDAFFLSTLEKRKIPGAVIAVVRQGKIAFTKEFGVADRERATKITPDTQFYIGSVSKMFTATLVMRLVQEGKFSLDEKVNKYLSKFPQSYDDITIRHLLSHTSGIQRDFKLHNQSLYGQDLYKELDSAPLTFQPGTKVGYSNTDYILLSMLIEAVTKMSYEKALTEYIFKPLKMSSTFYAGSGNTAFKLATGYEWTDSGFMRIEHVPLRFGAGGIISTVNDLASWDAALYSEKILSSKALTQMWTIISLPQGNSPFIGYDDAARKLNIGFGWFVSDYLGHRVVHHGGNIDGYSAQFDRFLDDKTTIIVLCNNEAGTATLLAKLVADKFLPGLEQNSIAALNQRARFAYYQKEFETAAKLNLAAVEKGDESPDTLFFIARAYSAQGGPDKAFAFLETALAKGFKNPDWLKDSVFDSMRKDSRWEKISRLISKILEMDNK